METLPFYGITDEKRKIISPKNNLIHAWAVNLQAYDWRKLVKVKMILILRKIQRYLRPIVLYT